jgi:ABC-type Fe3+ transport system permease subunit
MLHVDKLLHLLVGFAITLVVVLLGYPLVGLVVTVIVATGKEVYDYYNKESHTADGLDLIVTIVGGLLAVELYQLL